MCVYLSASMDAGERVCCFDSVYQSKQTIRHVRGLLLTVSVLYCLK